MKKTIRHSIGYKGELMKHIIFIVIFLLLLSMVLADVEWTEDFAANTDWATWKNPYFGFNYANSATNCINDDNDDCIYAYDGSTEGTPLDKQSDIDMSNCVANTAIFYIEHLKEVSTLESGDCIYIWYSDDSGSSFSNQTEIFCDDDPASPWSTTIPNDFFVSGFRLRLTFGSGAFSDEEAYLDGFKVNCTETTDTCTPPESGDYSVTASDNCEWTEADNIPGNVYITGAGNVTLSAAWTFTGSNQIISVGSGSTFIIKSGGSIE